MKENIVEEGENVPSDQWEKYPSHHREIMVQPSLIIKCNIQIQETSLAMLLGTICFGKSSASQVGDPGLNPGGGLTRVTQCMNERGKDYQL